ncbi:unnamed protein product, partial [Rotaria sp. Silwood2]
TLRKRWLENVNNNNVSISSSLTNSNVKSISSNIQILSSSQDHLETNPEYSRKQPQISTTSTFQASSSDLFKSISSLRGPIDKETNEKFTLFEPILNCSNHLLNLLCLQHLSKLREVVQLMIDEICRIQSIINLYDEPSLRHAKQTILGIKDQINKTFYEKHID